MGGFMWQINHRYGGPLMKNGESLPLSSTKANWLHNAVPNLHISLAP